MRWFFILVCVLSGLGTQSLAMEQSLRPVARPEALDVKDLNESLRPQSRPASIKQQAQKVMAQRKAGSVCGNSKIQGKPIGTKRGHLRACTVENAVQVSSVAGVRLSQASVMDCTTAKRLLSWTEKTLQPQARKIGKRVQKISVIGHFSCRTRNGQPGAKLSEHGKGRAIDISGFEFTDGTKMTLLKDWKRKGSSAFLRAVHRGACGPFGTVLGPNANKYHLDHFHFDTARYRSGSYCR